MSLEPLRKAIRVQTETLKAFSDAAREAALEARRAKGKQKPEEQKQGESALTLSDSDLKSVGMSPEELTGMQQKWSDWTKESKGKDTSKPLKVDGDTLVVDMGWASPGERPERWKGRISRDKDDPTKWLLEDRTGGSLHAAPRNALGGMLR